MLCDLFEVMKWRTKMTHKISSAYETRYLSDIDSAQLRTLTHLLRLLSIYVGSVCSELVDIKFNGEQTALARTALQSARAPDSCVWSTGCWVIGRDRCQSQHVDQ